MEGIYLRAKTINCNGIDDYEEEKTAIISLEYDEEHQVETVKEHYVEAVKEHQIEAVKEGPILRRSKRIAGIPADGPSVIDGDHKVTGDTTVITIHLDEGVGIVDASTPKAVNFIFNTSINSDPGEPKSIIEALNGTEKKWWKFSGIAEVNNSLSRDAWKFVLKSFVTDRKLVGTKVIFKMKDEIDGIVRFKTRIVTLGYMQIPGVEYRKIQSSRL